MCFNYKVFKINKELPLCVILYETDLSYNECLIGFEWFISSSFFANLTKVFVVCNNTCAWYDQYDKSSGVILAITNSSSITPLSTASTTGI